MAWNDEVVKYAENAVAVKKCQEDIKQAIELVGIDMTGVGFSSYANKVKEVAAVSGGGHVALITSTPLYPQKVDAFDDGYLYIGVTSAINPTKFVCHVGQGNADSGNWTWNFTIEGRRKGTDTWDVLCRKSVTAVAGTVTWIENTFTVTADYYYDYFRVTSGDRARLASESYITITGLVTFDSDEEVTWLSKTGELAVVSSAFSTVNNSAGGSAGSDIFKFDTPIRNISGYMTVEGSGGDPDYRQFGTEVYCFLDASCSEDNMTTCGWSCVTSTGERTVNFSLGGDIEIYGIKYTVWTSANGGSSVPTATCTEAKITGWEYLVTA